MKKEKEKWSDSDYFSLTHWNMSTFCPKPTAFHTRSSLIYFLFLSNICEKESSVLSQSPSCLVGWSVWWLSEIPFSRLDEHWPCMQLGKNPVKLISLRSPQSALGFQVSQGCFFLYNQFRALCSESGTGKT